MSCGRPPGWLAIQPLLGDRRGDRVRHQVTDRTPLRDAAADRRGRDVDSRHVEEHDPIPVVQWIEPPRDVLATNALALGHGEPGEPEDRLGLAPRREALGHVASDDEGQVVLWLDVM